MSDPGRLFCEIRAQGYRGSKGTVIDYLRPFRTNGRRRTTGPSTRTRRLAHRGRRRSAR
jgi:hypothetical protein